MSSKKKEKKEDARVFKAQTKQKDPNCHKEKKKREKKINRLKEFDMLPKKRRLSRESIKKILTGGKSIRSQNMSLRYLVAPSQLSAFAFVASAKVAKSAVSRNKLKRRGRVVVFKLLPQIKENLLAIIFFGKGSEKMKFPELEKEITELFRKAIFFNS